MTLRAHEKIRLTVDCFIDAFGWKRHRAFDPLAGFALRFAGCRRAAEARHDLDRHIVDLRIALAA